MKRIKLRKEEIKTPKAAQAPPGALFSQGIRAGDFIFISGAPMSLDRNFIKADFKAAARRVFENTEEVSKAAGASLENAVRVDGYMRDLENFTDFADVYLEYFPKPYPILGVCQPGRPPTDTPLGTIATILAGGLEKEEVKTKKAGTPRNALFSQGIKAADFVFTQAGPFDLDGRLIKADFKTCVKRTYENVRAVLEEAGSSMSNLVRTDNYLRDLEDVDEFNEVYAEYVPKPYPTRGLCQPARLPLNMPVATVATAIAS